MERPAVVRDEAEPPHLAIVLMGVAGTGKSRVLAELRAHLGWPALEGDDLHSPANLEKMRAGVPLTDEDRRPWLDAIATWLAEQRQAGESCLVTCSALRRSYRDRLRAGNPAATFVHLVAPEGVLAERVRNRPGHAFAPSLLPSQLATLEPLTADERGFKVDVTDPPGVVAARIVAELGLRA